MYKVFSPLEASFQPSRIGDYVLGKRVVELGIAGKIAPEEFEELLLEFERIVRRGIEQRLRRRLDELEVIVEGEIEENGKLNVRVDVRASGRVIAPLSYEEVLAEAIEEAARWLEAELRSRVVERESKEASRGPR